MTDSQKTKVLILDDEEFLRYMYQIVFERNGYEVTTFGSADDAIQALKNGYDPEIILFDVTMPQGKSGYEFLEILGREELGKRSMKIALTNEGQDGELARLTELGADGHMLKAAYIPSQLASKVTELLAARRAKQAA